ncbi:hypothetical protein C7271_26600 [filamentous cyanobacterium CCP5]|nr:hypothetical protein C7271_26600 [filamentous cyanobacterium CCP5]
MANGKNNDINIGSVQGSSLNLAQDVSGDVHQSADTTWNQGQVLTPEEVIDQLTQLEALFSQSDLPEADKQTVMAYVETAKEEAQAEEPDKGFAAKSLQKAAQTLKRVNETLGVGQDLWQKLEPIFKTLAPWLGVAAQSLILL